MKIGVLQTGHLPDEIQTKLGDYDRIFTEILQQHGFAVEVWPVVDGEFPDGADAADGWLITGSKYGAYEDLPWIAPLEDLVRQIAQTGRPLVGICFGHQIIAQALGGRVEKFAGGWSIGRQAYRYKGRELTANAWHQDQVTELPAGAKVIASSDFCANAGLLIGDTIWTIQPHPEFGTDATDLLVRHRAPGVVPDDLIQKARAQLGTPTDRDVFLEDIAAFFRKEQAA